MIRHAAALTLDDWYKLLGITALVSGGALFLYRKVVHRLFHYVRSRINRVSTALDSVETIRKEMFPNSGSSMRDSVNRTSHAVLEMARHVSMSIAQNRSLFEQAEAGMFECDVEGEVVWANRALRKVSGMRLEQVIGSGWINAIHDDDRRRVENDWRLATQQRRPFLSMFRFTHIGSGASIPVHCEAYPVFADGGDGAGWLGIVRAREVEA